MADQAGPPPRSAAHADHDPLLVAAAVDRGAHLPPALAACPDCAALHAELVTLAAAVPSAALPARPRTYTLSQADADRLRAPAWRRWLGSIGTSRDAITRPLALGFTTIGLAGLLVATVPGALSSGGAAGAATERYESIQVAAPAASSGPNDLAGAPAPGAATSGDGEATDGGTGILETPATVQLAAPPDPMVVASVALMGAGLALFVVRRVAGRGNRPSDEPVSPPT